MSVINNDPFGGIKSEKGSLNASPDEVRAFHQRSDSDSATTAQHHTLGTKRNQATAGDHIHDGKNSRLIASIPFVSGATLSISGQLNPTTVAQVDAMLDQVIAWFSQIGFTINDTRA